MSQYFRIKKGSVLPSLRMELVDDGRYGFMKRDTYNKAIQNAEISFSMRNEKGELKVSNAKANIVLPKDNCCNESYIIEYLWKERDTREEGMFEGEFEIFFKDDIKEEGVTFPSGKLIMPINEKLMIHVI